MSNSTAPAPNVPTSGVDFVFDSGLKKIDEQLKSADSLDVKMGVLIGFLGALIAGLLATLLASDPEKLGRLLSSKMTEVGLALTATLLALDLLFAFQAFRMRKLYSGVRFQDLVEWANEDSVETKRTFLSTLIETVNLNERQLTVKQRNAVRAIWSVFITLLTLLSTLGTIGLKLVRSYGG